MEISYNTRGGSQPGAVQRPLPGSGMSPSLISTLCPQPKQGTRSRPGSSTARRDTPCKRRRHSAALRGSAAEKGADAAINARDPLRPAFRLSSAVVPLPAARPSLTCGPERPVRPQAPCRRRRDGGRSRPRTSRRPGPGSRALSSPCPLRPSPPQEPQEPERGGSGRADEGRPPLFLSPPSHCRLFPFNAERSPPRRETGRKRRGGGRKRSGEEGAGPAMRRERSDARGPPSSLRAHRACAAVGR